MFRRKEEILKLITCLCIILLLLPALSVHFAYGTTYDWSKPRPSATRDFNQTLVSASSDGKTGVGISTTVVGYTEDSDDFGNPPLDYLSLRIALSAETREGITYDEYLDSYSWHSVSRPTNITADNTGVLLNISDCAPYLGPILFFGVAYTSLWVSDNGFISFDSTQNDSSPCSLPNSAYKHAIVAPLWRSLIPDGSSSITYDAVVIGSEWALVVSWNNIRDATGNRQTFQVVIWHQYSTHDSHPFIIFEYNSITSYQNTTIGVQNQAGSRGTQIDLSHAYNAHAVKLWSLDSANYQLTQLTIRLDKSSDSNADIIFEPPSNQTTQIEGYNIEKENSENPYGSLWIVPFDYLAGAFLAGVTNPAAGLICAMLLTTFDTGVAVTDALYNSKCGTFPALRTDHAAIMNATTRADLTMLPFDADMAAVVFLRLYDPNTVTHVVTITGEAVYQCVGDPALTYPADTHMTLNLFTGQHYLDVSTVLEGSGAVANGVTVTLDGQPYTSPVSLSNISDGNHQISVESPIYRNGVKYHFDMWTPGDSYSNPLTLNFSHDYDLTAHYRAYVYDLTINATYGGNTLPFPGVHEYQSGDTVGVIATPNVTAGYWFSKWLINGSFYSSFHAVNVLMDNNYVLQAQFDNHYNLTVSSSLWGTTNPYPDLHTYTYGTSVNVTALPWTDCVFDYWTLDGTNYTQPNPITVNMTANHSIMAHFHDASGGGGEGRCPTLFSWSGTDYTYYGVIPLHNASGYDVIKEVPVNASDVCVNNYQAQFRLREGWLGLNSSESVIDQVRLYAVDAYGHRLFCPLANATHSRLGNVLLQLLFSDDWRAQMTLLETVDLRFVVPYPSFLVKGYVFVIEGCNQFKQ